MDSVHGDFIVDKTLFIADPAEIGECEYVLFCVKSCDTDQAAAAIGPMVGTGTAVVTLQNGIDNEDKLSVALGADRALHQVLAPW